MPFRGSNDVITSNYFGAVPPDRLTIGSAIGTGSGADKDRSVGLARFKADSQLRSKIGVSSTGATGWLGAYDKTRGVLTLVQYPVPAAGAIVPDCNWVDPNPKAKSGDVATSYNHGQEPRFFELESIGTAMPVKPGGSVTHVHTTIHLGGDPVTLAKIAEALLGAKL